MSGKALHSGRKMSWQNIKSGCIRNIITFERQYYTTETDRHYLGPMDQICSKCGVASFKDETPQWCCDKGKTDVVAPESDQSDESNAQQEEDATYDGVETAINGPINPDEDANNKILHSVRPGTT